MQKLNFTPIPNELADKYMKNLSGSELKVYFAICRKTIGWHKDTDAVSISQLMEMTGLSKQGVVSATTALLTPGSYGQALITAEKGYGKTTKYGLVFTEEIDLSNNLTSTSQKTGLVDPKPLVKKVDTQKKEDPIPRKLSLDERNLPAPAGKEDIRRELYTRTQSAFTSKWKYEYNFKKEGPATKRLVESAMLRADPPRFMATALNLFWRKINNQNDKIFFGKAFLPSQLSCSFIWPLISKEVDAAPEDAALREHWKPIFERMWGTP